MLYDKNGMIVRKAVEQDTGLILEFIRELAEYEHLSAKVIAREPLLREELFVKKGAEVLIGEINGTPAGFALFFHNFSTFLGRSGIYLEDLYVKESFRGRGLGKTFFSILAQLARERSCGRLEWACLNWNKSAVDFYKRMGAEPQSEWTVFRLGEEKLEKLI